MAGELSGRLEVIEAELSDVKKRLEKLYEAIETSELTLEVLSPRVMSLRHREEQLEAARDDAETQLEHRRVELPNTEEITQYVADFRDFLQEGTIPERKALIRNFVEGIEVVGDEATLTYTVPMPSDGVTSESASVLDFVKSGPPSCIVDTMALRGLLGDEARVSASTVARLKEKWHAELAEWRQRPLDDLKVVYMWVDGVLRQGRPGEGEGGHPGGAGGAQRWPQGRCHRNAWLPGVNRELVRGAARLEGARFGVPKAGDWRRSLGHLGSSAQRLSRSSRVTLLEPQDPQRAGQATKERAGSGQAAAVSYPLLTEP